MMRAPFPYFGGKSKIAAAVWAALGRPKRYIEPFFGSGAVLFGRPGYDARKHIETVCDIDGYVANVWRALQADPYGVARYCDWPVSHADLAARRNVLLRSRGLLDRLVNDDTYYDIRLAGYWIWCSSCWIGDGMLDGETGMCRRPHISNTGIGVHKLTTRCAPDYSADVRAPYSEEIYRWFRALAERLRYVHVVCGDWTRVCGGDWQDKCGTVGIFFDPPYGVADRDTVYTHDSTDVAHAVREWCIERGARPTHRIVLAGYDEHMELVERHGWRMLRWSANGGYGNIGDGGGKRNRHRETLYISPHCVDGTAAQIQLSDGGDDDSRP